MGGGNHRFRRYVLSCLCTFLKHTTLCIWGTWLRGKSQNHKYKSIRGFRDIKRSSPAFHFSLPGASTGNSPWVVGSRRTRGTSPESSLWPNDSNYGSLGLALHQATPWAPDPQRACTPQQADGLGLQGGTEGGDGGSRLQEPGAGCSSVSNSTGHVV